ncbi:MFS transporter [Deminuibacter soli]|uniref:MFS transporter n=1 Tax=Deminuibacter soli TaxID=2291815 RepID=A0A3E1NNL9_9BACT|nr:MFS transporter [Deminuibacter soli]RFM29522.1 MFS transporter [Deminuibacter soli]
MEAQYTATATAPAAKGISRGLTILLAIATGISVANIYYNQPILKEIADAVGVSEGHIGNVSMFTQVGYGLGLFFLIPLGDKVNRKRLIFVLLFLLTLTLIGISFATSLAEVSIYSVLIGLLSVSAQIIIPMAASMDKVNRGKTVGIIISGLLIGILSARIFSGLIAEWMGWRYVFRLSAILVVTMMVLLQLLLPAVKNDFTGNYLSLLKSTVQQFKQYSLLREACFSGALLFGIFCSFWTTFTFHLSAPPFNYHSDTIGSFGFVAIAGALAASFFGKQSDKGNHNARRNIFIAIGFIAASVLAGKLFPDSVIAMIAFVLLLDVGIQAAHVSNMARIYTLSETSLSRVNTVYMTCYFIGGSLGTFVGTTCWRIGGWSLVTWSMLLWCTLAVLVMAKKRAHH